MHLLYFFRIPTGLTAIAMPVQIIFHLCKNYLGIIWNYLVLISNTNVVIVKVRKHALKIYNQLTSTGSCKIPRLFFILLFYFYPLKNFKKMWTNWRKEFEQPFWMKKYLSHWKSLTITRRQEKCFTIGWIYSTNCWYQPLTRYFSSSYCLLLLFWITHPTR